MRVWSNPTAQSADTVSWMDHHRAAICSIRQYWKPAGCWYLWLAMKRDHWHRWHWPLIVLGSVTTLYFVCRCWPRIAWLGKIRWVHYELYLIYLWSSRHNETRLWPNKLVGDCIQECQSISSQLGFVEMDEFGIFTCKCMIIIIFCLN